jgi:hypothetical protein
MSGDTERRVVVPLKHHLDKRGGEIAEVGAGDPDDLLDTRSVAMWFGCSEQWLEIGRSKNYGPPYIKMSPKRVRYRRGDLRGWLRERTRLYAAGAGE